MGARVELVIPRYIDDYNYNIGGVDIADQHRAAYSSQRKALRNWIPTWYWMVDSVVVNAFKIGVFIPGKYWNRRQYRAFRERLWQELLEFSEEAAVKKQQDMLPTQRLERPEKHTYVKMAVRA